MSSWSPDLMNEPPDLESIAPRTRNQSLQLTVRRENSQLRFVNLIYSTFMQLLLDNEKQEKYHCMHVHSIASWYLYEEVVIYVGIDVFHTICKSSGHVHCPMHAWITYWAKSVTCTPFYYHYDLYLCNASSNYINLTLLQRERQQDAMWCAYAKANPYVLILYIYH